MSDMNRIKLAAPVLPVSAGHHGKEIAPLIAYDPASLKSLGEAALPEFSEYAYARGQDKAGVSLIWSRLAALNAHAAGLPSPLVGRLTPGPKDGLKPFMHGPEGKIITPEAPDLADATLALDGLYGYMSHPDKLVVGSFGPQKRSTVHEFLNHRIEQTT